MSPLGPHKAAAEKTAAATGRSSLAMLSCTRIRSPSQSPVFLVRSTLPAAHSSRFTSPEKATRSQPVRDNRARRRAGGGFRWEDAADVVTGVRLCKRAAGQGP